jgi:hypothetical protein
MSAVTAAHRSNWTMTADAAGAARRYGPLIRMCTARAGGGPASAMFGAGAWPRSSRSPLPWPRGLGVGISSYVDSHQSGPPTAAGSGDTSVVESVPPGSTDLQALRQDFGPWRQLTGQSTDGPALLLLDGGIVYASQRWTVPSTATWWAQDLGGNVTSVQDTGGRASITDADGVGYTVGISQAFIIASNPDTVLLISPDSTVRSMSLAQATAVRQSLGK